jgi:hypothetical protein
MAKRFDCREPCLVLITGESSKTQTKMVLKPTQLAQKVFLGLMV